MNPNTAYCTNTRKKMHPDMATVLMCDIVSSTSLAEELAPEDFGNLLNDYYDTCESCIGVLQGRVVQYVGDGIMCLFTHTLENNGPERAVSSATALINKIGQISTPANRNLQVRITIATGPCVLSLRLVDSGHKQELVFGTTPFLADRLKPFACPNEILVCSTTAGLLGSSHLFQKKGRVELKGFNDDHDVWHLSTTKH